MTLRKLTLSICLLAIPLAAQIVGPSRWGSEKAFSLGAVNRGTLGVHLEFPIFTRATGTGAQVGLRLVYDSQFWNGGSTWWPTPGFGWRLEQPFGTLNHVRDVYDQYCGWWNNNTGSYDEWWNLVTDTWTFVEPDGSEPSADYASSEYLELGGGGRQHGDTYDCSPVSGTGTTQIPDGKGYTIEVFNPNQSIAYAEAFDSSGNEIDGLLKDPNGNQVTTSTGSGTTSYFDPLSAANGNAAALTQTGSGTPSSPVYFTYTGSNGNSVSVRRRPCSGREALGGKLLE